MGGVFSHFCCNDLGHLWRPSRRSDYVGNEADQASLLPPSSSSPPPPVWEDEFQYDVFLSFRGPDTRKGFISYLYDALKQKGIPTFIDSEELEKGRKVEELFGYIERSKIFVPVFSKGYADSKWCLKEMAKIMECKRLVIPVFFHVDPNEVRHQTGPFADAFRDYLEKEGEEVSTWSAALTEAGKISGYHLGDGAPERNEAKVVQFITKRVLAEVNKTSLFVSPYPVGLDARITDVMGLLDLGAGGDAKMVGIHGMGGIGKTTLAKAVYNQISNHFEACSYISKIREAAKKSSRLVSLQQQLLRDLLGEENKFNSIDQGIGIIQQRMRSKKFLLFLDDIDDKSQLEAFGGDVRWFCSGSRIIVTTRNKQVFKKQVKLYEPKVLDDVQSLELFSWHAFGKKQPTEAFAELSKEAASTAKGLPLALTIFGAHFFDFDTVKKWEDGLKILKEDKFKHIHESLKVSFHALEEREKKVFLDIACFLIGERREIVEHATIMWEDCGFFPEITIQVLVHKSLVSINCKAGKLEMHDHIRDMGRKIVVDESVYKGSRLWVDDKTLDILENKRGLENAEAIAIGGRYWRWWPWASVVFPIEAFAIMPQLRMLRLGYNVTMEGRCDELLKTVRWLEWQIPPHLKSLPDAICLEKMVVLDLSRSCGITEVWNPQRSTRKKVHLNKLRLLNLRECRSLATSPDFTTIPHLQQLDFTKCRELREVHPSIGLLKSLTRLRLSGCESLVQLPREIYQMTSLEELDLRWCFKITSLPSPSDDSKVCLNKLRVVNLTGCISLTSCPDFSTIPHLQQLNFNHCLRLRKLHPSIGLLKNLIRLALRLCTSIKQLPEEIYQLTALEELDLSYCFKIIRLPSPPEDSKVHLNNLRVLKLSGCLSLTSCPDFTSMPQLKELDFESCEKMEELHPSIWHLKWLATLSFKYCYSLKELGQKFLQGEFSGITSLPSHVGDSSSIKEPVLEKLKYLDFSCCRELTICPDFTSMPYLEELHFDGCEKMGEPHPSIWNLKCLTRFHFQD
ncbi:unnamed protein product [Victoria cruziana]